MLKKCILLNIWQNCDEKLTTSLTYLISNTPFCTKGNSFSWKSFPLVLLLLWPCTSSKTRSRFSFNVSGVNAIGSQFFLDFVKFSLVSFEFCVHLRSGHVVCSHQTMFHVRLKFCLQFLGRFSGGRFDVFFQFFAFGFSGSDEARRRGLKQAARRHCRSTSSWAEFLRHELFKFGITL